MFIRQDERFAVFGKVFSDLDHMLPPEIPLFFSLFHDLRDQFVNLY